VEEQAGNPAVQAASAAMVRAFEQRDASTLDLSFLGANRSAILRCLDVKHPSAGTRAMFGM
jgi:hypothetical protein